MSSQALSRKWRPAKFDEVVGQEHITRTILNTVVAGRVGHAYLFCGPRGTGKTTSARLLAKAVNCLHPEPAQRPCNECSICLAINQGRFLDLIEIDAASNTGVDDIRDLRERINFAPSEGRFKVYIIDEVHMLSTAAFNALLKTLEEPPAHAKFILATTEEHKVPITIKSRCQQFNFRLLTAQEIVERLQLLVDREHLQVEPEVLSLVAQHGSGSLRDSESLLDQLIGAPGELITVKRAQMVLGTASSATVSGLANAILTADGPAGLHIIQEALNTGADARQLCRQMVSHLRDLLLLQTAGDQIRLDMPKEQQADLLAQAQRASRPTLIHATKLFSEAASAPATSWQPQLPLELAFIQAISGQPVSLSAGQPVSQSASQSVSQSAGQPVSQSASQSVSQSAGQSVSQPVSQSASQPVSQSAGQQVSPSAAPNPQSPIPNPQSPIPNPQSPPSGLTIEEVRAKWWKPLVAEAGRTNRNIRNWLNSAQPLAVEGGTVLVLGFDFDFLRSKLEAEQDKVAEVLSRLVGTAVRLKCVMNGSYTPPTAAGQYATTPTFRDDVEQLARELGGTVSEG